MAAHSSTLAWRSPWTEEPGGLQSTGSQIVGHDKRVSMQALAPELGASRTETGFRHGCIQESNWSGRNLFLSSLSGLASLPLGLGLCSWQPWAHRVPPVTRGRVPLSQFSQQEPPDQG